MVATDQNTQHKSKAAIAEIKRLKQANRRLREDAQIAADQRDYVMSEHSSLAEMAIQVASVAVRAEDNPDVYIVPAGAMDALMFLLKGDS